MRQGRFDVRMRSRGASLVVALLMLVAVATIGLSAAHIALHEEKASRNDRNRQIALQAAQAALVDAERDIAHSPRSHLFSQQNAEGFDAGCGDGRIPLYQGLCRRSAQHANPVWLTVDLVGDGATSYSVPYGRFTGHHLVTGAGQAPAQLPRYVIERVAYDDASMADGQGGIVHFYRITAIGFGMKASTQVVLQSCYRPADGTETELPAGRFCWREIPNWRELHDALANK